MEIDATQVLNTFPADILCPMDLVSPLTAQVILRKPPLIIISKLCLNPLTLGHSVWGRGGRTRAPRRQRRPRHHERRGRDGPGRRYEVRKEQEHARSINTIPWVYSPSLGLFPPLLCGGLRRRRKKILGGLRSNLDDFLGKIDDFEVQILKIF